MSEYDGSQFVGIDLHRRRSVIVRSTEAGESLEVVRINNDLDSLAAVMARAGEAPQGTGSRAAGLAMAFKFIESAQARWRAVNAPHLVAFVPASATFE